MHNYLLSLFLISKHYPTYCALKIDKKETFQYVCSTSDHAVQCNSPKEVPQVIQIRRREYAYLEIGPLQY